MRNPRERERERDEKYWPQEEGKLAIKLQLSYLYYRQDNSFSNAKIPERNLNKVASLAKHSHGGGCFQGIAEGCWYSRTPCYSHTALGKL